MNTRSRSEGTAGLLAGLLLAVFAIAFQMIGVAAALPEAMRSLSMQVTPRAMLTRAAAGIKKRTLIVNLPGSAKAVEECLGFVLPQLAHGIEILHGDAGECARK